MDNIPMWIIIGVLAAIIVAFIAYKIIIVIKMNPEDREKLLITYLKGLIALAEYEIGNGHGAEKLAMVEELFRIKAPFIYKAVLQLFGKENLRELIEKALAEIKQSFEK